jgi:TolB-like protein
MSFIGELKRRNVFRVAAAYLLAAWVLLQAIDFLLDAIAAPNWILQVFIIAAAVGFIAVLVFSWVFEMTPEGIKREKDIDRTQSITPQTGRKLDRVIIAFLAVAVVLLLADRFIEKAEKGPEKGPDTFSSAEKEASATDVAENVSGPFSGPFSAASAKSIAVLPFADLSQAHDQEWFADGLAEEILNTLAKTPDLLVTSRTSSFRYKKSELDLPQIAAELGVAHILEGSVRSSANRIRVTAQLIRASDGFHLWSENYDRDVADMIAIQEDLALNIAQALETTMDPAALAEMTSAGTRSVAAYQDYLKGLSLLANAAFNSQAGKSVLEAYERFEQARATDPKFASAHAMAADFWLTQLSPSRTDSGLTELEPLQMATEFSERMQLAIETAPSEVDRTGYMARRALFDLRLGESVRLFREYLEHRPNDQQAWFSLGQAAALASAQGVSEEILEHYRVLGQQEASAANNYVNWAYLLGKASLGADYGIEALARWPTHLNLVYQTHRSLLWAGRVAEAAQMAERYRQLNPDSNPIVEARQACAEGRRGDAEAILAGLDPEDSYDRSTRWHILKLLGLEQEAAAVLQPYADSGVPYQLADWLGYHKFDPTPFPAIMAVLEREGIDRPPAVDIPFKCPPE